MVRPMSGLYVANGSAFPAIPLAVGLFVSASLLAALCAKRARHRLCAAEPNTDRNVPKKREWGKIMPSFHARKAVQEHPAGDEPDGVEKGIWHKEILMGERCQPLDFSGVIFYDCSGNRVPEMPRSPRASPFRIV